MKRKALRVRSEGSIPPYVTEAESRKQHSDSPLCNSLTLQELAKRLEVKPKALLPILQKLLEEDDRYRTDGVHLYKNK